MFSWDDLPISSSWYTFGHTWIIPATRTRNYNNRLTQGSVCKTNFDIIFRCHLPSPPISHILVSDVNRQSLSLSDCIKYTDKLFGCLKFNDIFST